MNSYINEIIEAAKLTETECCVLSKEKAKQYIKQVLDKFNPQKTQGHLSIYNNSASLPVNEYEFTYGSYLPQEPAYLFFDQVTKKDTVIKISNAQKTGELLLQCSGMEYFLSNEASTYLIAVNWYVVEGAGEALQWMEPLGATPIE